MDDFLSRIVQVFNRNKTRETRDAVWENCMAKALAVDLNEHNLENMMLTDLVTGFGYAQGFEQLVLLAEALGVSGITNPENNVFCNSMIPSKTNVVGLSVDQILDRIQGVMPFDITFPKFNGNASTILNSKYGSFGDRTIHYLWIVKRVTELCPDRSVGIIEIGAGFGILGYYLSRLGYRDYTTIDLSLINACQAYYLHKNIPDRNIILSGDVADPFDTAFKDSVKLLHSSDFGSVPSNRFAIMVNMDGFTEYGIEQAKTYIQSDCFKTLLSVNHEVNPFRVCEIPQPKRKMAYRYLFWTRPGYVEELYVPKD